MIDLSGLSVAGAKAAPAEVKAEPTVPTPVAIASEPPAVSFVPVDAPLTMEHLDALMKQAVPVASAPIAANPVSADPDEWKYMTPREVNAARVQAARDARLARVVPIQVEPAAALDMPAGVPLTDPSGVVRAVVKTDGSIVPVTSEISADTFVNLSEADKAPVVDADEVRLDLFPRSSGRIKFLEATYELGYPERTAARQQNDLGRALYQKSLTAKPFDPEKSANADKIKRFLQ